MESKILLTNYPRISQSVQFEEVVTKKTLDVVVGYDIDVNSQVITEQIAGDLITSLLLYDKVYVEGSHLIDIMQVFGSEYLKELLRLKLIHVIPDQNLNPAIKREDNNWKVGFFAYPQVSAPRNQIPRGFEINKWSHIETGFSKKGLIGQQAKTILYLIDENSVNLDEEEISRRVEHETALDLYNHFLLDQLKLVDPSSGKLTGADFSKLLRLQELNKTGVLASSLNIDNIKTDAEISAILALKSLSEFDKEYGNGVDALNRIEYEKGFPDLGKLFRNEVIGLEDILKLREGFHGKIFRYWAQTTEYDEKLMRQEVMNLTRDILGSKMSNTIRLITFNLVGIAGFIPGVISSAFDSFILNKIAKGWHPNFFLDKKVKAVIDKCIARKEQEHRRELAQLTFKGVGRNDSCPCGSGKKFKKCHGFN